MLSCLILRRRGVPAAPPLFGVQNNFERLFAADPNGEPEEVKARIGREKEDWIENTCARRASHAMNFSGALAEVARTP